MIIDKLASYWQSLTGRSIAELPYLQRWVRFMWDLSCYGWAQMRRDRAAEMAAALTYRTIFSLVPLFVLGLVVFKAFGGFQGVGNELQTKAYAYLGLTALNAPAQVIRGPNLATAPATQEAAPETPATAPGATQPAPRATDEQLRLSMERTMSELTEKVTNINFKSIGAVGLILLIWAAIALVVTMEDSFNQIYRAPSGRSWHLRVSIYWAMITLGPVLVFVSVYLAGEVQQAIERLHTVPDLAAGQHDWASRQWAMMIMGSLLSGVVKFLTSIMALTATWLLLFLLYRLMPNTRVHTRPALIGSFVAALLWEGAKVGFRFYVSKAVGNFALYGTLGLIPLFLFWLYLTWLIVLFGLELTHALQILRGRRNAKACIMDDSEVWQLSDPDWLVPMMVQIGQAFRRGETVDQAALATDLAIPERAVAELLLRLEQAKLVNRVQPRSDEEGGFALAMPPESIPMARLLELAHKATHPQAPPDPKNTGWKTLRQLWQAQDEAAANQTLASVLGEGTKA